MKFTIIRNDERYNLEDKEGPHIFIVDCNNKESAIWIAKNLSNNFPGMDYAYYIQGIDD